MYQVVSLPEYFISGHRRILNDIGTRLRWPQSNCHNSMPRAPTAKPSRGTFFAKDLRLYGACCWLVFRDNAARVYSQNEKHAHMVKTNMYNSPNPVSANTQPIILVVRHLICGDCREIGDASFMIAERHRFLIYFVCSHFVCFICFVFIRYVRNMSVSCKIILTCLCPFQNSGRCRVDLSCDFARFGAMTKT